MTDKTLDLSDAEIEEVRKLAEIHPLELAKTELGSTIGQAMRSACPVPGTSWDRLITVILPLKGRREVPAHAHQRHLILYYPEACDPVIIEGETIHPTRGMIIYAPPLTKHTVPPIIKDTRLSVAMLVSEDENARLLRMAQEPCPLSA